MREVVADMIFGQAGVVAPLSTRLDLEELQKSTTAMICTVLMLVGALFSWLLLPGADFQRWGFLVSLSLLLEGVVGFCFWERKPIVSRVILLIGSTLSFSLALWGIESPAVPFFATLIVIASGAISPRLGFAAAILNTVPLCCLSSSGEMFVPSLALLWLAATLEWVSSRGLHVVLSWALTSQRRADGLVVELRDRQGELNRTVVALTEATRRLQHIGQQLALARLHADEARELKERFAANISHELRTPLNLILGFSETMYLTPDVYGDMQWPLTLRRDVRQIHQSSQQLLALINDVLDLSLIDAAEMPIHKEYGDLKQVIEEAVSTISDLLRGRDIELKAELLLALPRIAFDRTRIRQVLLNLLNNAARFTEQGSITVKAEAGEREVIISVSDTGLGIPTEELARIFDEFHQVDMSLRRRKEGAGLGLAISKRFVILHGGSIWAESELGKGSTFRFSLPLAPDAFAGALLRTEALYPAQGSREPTVVMVDHDRAIGAMLSRYLQGYQVLQPEDLASAEAMMARWHPRALVFNVPPHEEQGVCQEALRLMPPKVPVLICSMPSQSWVASERGVRGCLTKPISRQQLLDALREIGRVQDILVVDDDRRFVQLMARYLQGADDAYSVRWAYGGREALDQIQQKHPDVVLLDLIMPEVDGFEVMQALQADQHLRDIPVLIVTATDFAKDMLAQQSSMLSIARKSAFSSTEVIRYLQAILDVTEAEYPIDNLTAP